jgi:flagellar basal-body rod protein FlgG
MVGALTTAAAGMEAQQNMMDALSNDIANVSTTGYKSQEVGFRSLMYQAPGRGAGEGVVTGAGSAAEIIGENFEQGSLEQTGRSLDVALTTPGFIRVTTPGGAVALTRDGNLQIAPDGTVSAGKRKVGQISLVEVTNPNGLAPDGEGTWLPTAASGPVTAARGARVQQGTLEASNVDLADVMTQMSEAQQGYEMAGKAITTQDEVLAVANGLIR